MQDEIGLPLEAAACRERTAHEGAQIARRSIAEMKRTGTFTPEQEARWEAALRGLLPDVSAGDRIAGVHRPDAGAAFLVNGRPVGEIADPQFARLFFAIWLGPATSEPGCACG